MPSLDDHSRAKLSLSISKAQENRAALLRLRNSLVSPLCRMPYEIIVKIISLIPDPNEEDEHTSLLLAKSGPICHHVWSILQDTPKFWGHVNFSQHDGLSFLHRCRGRPIRLWIRYSPSEARNSWIAATLSSWFLIPTLSVESLEEFRFYGNPTDFESFRWIFNKPLQRLHTITAVSGRIQYSWVPEIIETWTISGQFLTGLRSVTLKQVFMPWDTIFTPHLINLDLDYTQTTEEIPISMPYFLGMLSLCTRLETLRLYCAGPETQDETLAHIPGTNPAHLANLRIFEIYNDPLNVAYIMNHLKLPDTTQILIEPSIEWPERLVSFSLPRTMRIYPTEGLIKWNVGLESSLLMGNTEFTYYMDADDEEFVEVFEQTFYRPFVEFASYSTTVLTALELDFDLEFEPDQAVWSTVLAGLPALKRLSCATRGFISHNFAPKFFAELSKGSHGGVHCQELKELDLSLFDLGDPRLIKGVIRALGERHQAGFPIQKIFWNKSFKAFDTDKFRRLVAKVGFLKALDDEVPL